MYGCYMLVVNDSRTLKGRMSWTTALHCLLGALELVYVQILLYLTLKEEIWYDLPGTLRGLPGDIRRLCPPGVVMNQVQDTKNRVMKA